MATVLVVDDMKFQRLGLRSILERAGHEVEEAADGNEATRKLRQNAYDLMLSDIYMPDKDGFELILETRKQYPDLKIIAMSAGAPAASGRRSTFGKAENVLQTASLFGADDVLAKPFKADDLLESISGCLNGDNGPSHFSN